MRSIAGAGAGPLGVGPVWNPRLIYAVDGYKTGGVLPCQVLSCAGHT